MTVEVKPLAEVTQEATRVLIQQLGPLIPCVLSISSPWTMATTRRNVNGCLQA